MSKNILGIFDGSDIEGITALIDKLDQSSFDYLKLEGDGVKIVIGKNGVSEASNVSAVKVDAPAIATTVPVVKAPVESAVQAAATVQEPAVKPARAISEEDGITVIKSPSYGLFYAQSEPGAPAYVNVGDVVKKGDTMGLLEIMKTFNAITSEVDGSVVQIHVQNQEVLEPNQPLFSIKVK